MKIDLEQLKSREIMPGFRGKMIHGQNMTLAFWEVDQDSEVPEHAHVHEQIMHVIDGRFEFTVGGVTQVYEAGELIVIPSETPHSGKALTPSSTTP